MPFICSICGEESTRICARCTKDACNNHICEKCLRCSDCCECEVTLSEHAHQPVRMVVRDAMVEDALETTALETGAPPDPEPEPEPNIPGPDPDPDPTPSPEEPGSTAA